MIEYMNICRRADLAFEPSYGGLFFRRSSLMAARSSGRPLFPKDEMK
jgi:hypothetical protein